MIRRKHPQPQEVWQAFRERPVTVTLFEPPPPPKRAVNAYNSSQRLDVADSKLLLAKLLAEGQLRTSR